MPEAEHSKRVTAALHRPGAGPAPVDWALAEEVPVAFEYNGVSHAVMMATPRDLEEYALGFSLCEGIVSRPEDIDSIAVESGGEGIVVSLRVDPRRLAAGSLRRRAMEGRSGCGLCGVESLSGVLRPLGQAVRGFEPSAAAVAAAFAGLPALQPMNAVNRSLHAAGWCTPDGTVRFAREDVGRHNALDKLAGALARAGTDPRDGFAVLTSRCSFELVQKAAAVGIPMLATVSAPTALAFELARRAGIVLAARAGDGVVIFG